MIFMTFNNLVFFCVWWIFFSKFKEINGWHLSELEAMYAFAAGSFGLVVIFGGGIFELSRKIIDGSLDPYLVQPKNILAYIIGSQSRASGWGDILTCIILFSMSGYLTGKNILLIIILLITAALIFLGAGIIAHSLAFWLGPVEQLSRQLFEFVLTFSVYPQTIFPFLFKIFLFTVLPAGFIGFLPVEVLRNFSWELLFFTIFSTIIYLLFASWVFSRGLKRYESGNRIGI